MIDPYFLYLIDCELIKVSGAGLSPVSRLDLVPRRSETATIPGTGDAPTLSLGA
jgi:hypothetical protein